MKEISPSELKARLENKEPLVLLDVREDFEVEVPSLPGRKHIPLGDLQMAVFELEGHKSAELVVYCRSGKRSASACMFLASQGFNNVCNLRGGITAWRDDVEPNMQVA